MQRAFDLIAGVILLVAAAPVLLLAAAAVWLQDRGPILFRQERVGRHGKTFTILKFRSMKIQNTGAAITSSGDQRITRAGKILRQYKIDELPQLWNVVRGDMSLIGPRPEIPQYVDEQDPSWRRVHSVRPGITDLATLLYRDEERILAGFDDPVSGYRDTVLPAKLALNVEYLDRRSTVRDLKLLALTVRYSFIPGGFDPLRVRNAILPRNK